MEQNELENLFNKRWTTLNNKGTGKTPRELAYSYFRAGWYLAQGVEEETSASFEVFWNLYDKKVGKEKSIKLWEKLSGRDKNACMEYIPRYKQAQPDKKYRKNPETFLRNKSWKDELIYSTDGGEQAKIRTILGI